MKNNAEKYLSHLDSIFEVQPVFTKISEKDDYPPLHCLTYKNIPEKGCITGITLGLSFIDYPNWKIARPELIISVESEDPSWAYASAYMAYQARGKFDFCIGSTINFREKISDESEMTAFFIFFQSLLDKSFEKIKLPEWDIHFIQLYPIYDDERILINEYGFEWFLKTNHDSWNVKRKNEALSFKKP